MSDKVQWDSFSGSPFPPPPPQGAGAAPQPPAIAQQRPLQPAPQPAAAGSPVAAAARPALLLRNSLKASVVMGAALLHLGVVGWLAQTNLIVLAVWVAYCVISMSITFRIYRRELGDSA